MVEIEEKQLKFAYWFTTNKEKIKKIGLIIFGLIDLMFISYSAWGFADYYLNLNKERQLFQNWSFIDFSQVREQNKPLPIQVLDTVILGGNFGKYDLVAKIKNPNDQWVIYPLSYHFLIDNNLTSAEQATFIMAGEEKYLMLLAHESPERIKNFTVQFDNIGWRRISGANNLKNIEIKISDIDLAPVTTKTSAQSNIQRVSFTAFNNSIYNIWEIGFQVVLLGSQNRPVAVDYIKVSNFPTNSSRKIEINFISPPPNIRKTIVLPEVNIFDENNFKKTEVMPESEVGR